MSTGYDHCKPVAILATANRISRILFPTGRARLCVIFRKWRTCCFEHSRTGSPAALGFRVTASIGSVVTSMQCHTETDLLAWQVFLMKFSRQWLVKYKKLSPGPFLCMNVEWRIFRRFEFYFIHRYKTCALQVRFQSKSRLPWPSKNGITTK